MKTFQRLVLATTLAFVPVSAVSAKDKPAVKTTNAKSMAGMSKVIVASFSIAFVTEKTDAAFAGARNNGKAMGAITKAKLAGMTPADFQAITDAAYADFLEKMSAAGFGIVDRAVMVADKQMAKVEYLPSGTQGSFSVGKDSDIKAVFYGPTAFGPTPLLKGETGTGGGSAAGKMIGGIFGAIKALGSMGGPAMAKTYYSIYNKQPTISVQYVIDFADVDRYGGRYAQIATVGLTSSLAVVETLSALNTINEKGAVGAVSIADAVAVPGNFGSMKDSTTTGQSLDNAAGALIGGLFGSGSNSYKHITFAADPVVFRAGAVKAVATSNGLVVTELAARR